jgi:hypothetical protein
VLIFILVVVALIVLVVIAERRAKPRVAGERPPAPSAGGSYSRGDATLGVHGGDGGGGGGAL